MSLKFFSTILEDSSNNHRFATSSLSVNHVLLSRYSPCGTFLVLSVRGLAAAPLLLAFDAAPEDTLCVMLLHLLGEF